MLHLHSSSTEGWFQRIEHHLDEVLIDHAHCEHKAAATAMSLLGSYIEHRELCEEMNRIIEEEMEHFFLVLDLLAKRDIRFRIQPPGNYGRELNKLIRNNEPQRAVDRLLVASLIEARSCQRFDLLSKHVRDPELAEFYASLFESEARHHTTYVRLAKLFASADEVKNRLEELSAAETAIIAQGHPLPRMHS